MKWEPIVDMGGLYPRGRLTNTTYTEVASRLPLVTLPVSFGSSCLELSLLNENEVSSRLLGKSEAVINSQAGKIVELLRATDINYLSLQEEAKAVDCQVSVEHGSLMAAVLLHDSDAFSYTLLGPHERGAWRLPPLERRQSQAGGLDYADPNRLKGPQQLSEGPCISITNSPSPARASTVKRKEVPESKIERHPSKTPGTGLLKPGSSNQGIAFVHTFGSRHESTLGPYRLCYYEFNGI